MDVESSICLSDLVPALRWSRPQQVAEALADPRLPAGWWGSLSLSRALGTTGVEWMCERLARLAASRWDHLPLADVLPALHVHQVDPSLPGWPEPARTVITGLGGWRVLRRLSTGDLGAPSSSASTEVVVGSVFREVLGRIPATSGAPAVRPAGALPQRPANVPAQGTPSGGFFSPQQAGGQGAPSHPGASHPGAPVLGSPVQGPAAAGPAGPSAPGSSTPDAPGVSRPGSQAPGAGAPGRPASQGQDQGSPLPQRPGGPASTGSFPSQPGGPSTGPFPNQPGAPGAGPSTGSFPSQPGGGPSTGSFPSQPAAGPSTGSFPGQPGGGPSTGSFPSRPAAGPSTGSFPSQPGGGPSTGSFPAVGPSSGAFPGQAGQPGPGSNGSHPGQPGSQGQAGSQAGPGAKQAQGQPGQSGQPAQPGQPGQTGQPGQVSPFAPPSPNSYAAPTFAAPPIAETPDDDYPMVRVVDGLFRSFDRLELAVAVNRLFAAEPDTLRTLAHKLLVDRDVLSQAQRTAEERVLHWLRSSESAPVTGHMFRLTEWLGTAATEDQLIGADPAHPVIVPTLRSPLWRVLVTLMPDRRLQDGWLVVGDLTGLQARTRQLLAAHPADADVEELLAELGIRRHSAKAWLDALPAEAPSDGPSAQPAVQQPLPRRTPGANGHHHRGGQPVPPAPPQQIDPSAALATLSALSGGRSPLLGGSSAPPPLLAGAPSTPPPPPPSPTSDPRRWQRIDVTPEHLRGAPVAVPEGYAAQLGMRPGTLLSVTGPGDNAVVLVWRDQQPVFDSLQPVLMRLNARPGDQVYVTVDGYRLDAQLTS
ncbi:hypothetical protein [Nonomuraea roseola]|uniref:Uncharacterized protein n=1 Tax=Nonomuraea roseola TaxID=46179 RepID=A0ABV5PUS7_9ACTN